MMARMKRVFILLLGALVLAGLAVWMTLSAVPSAHTFVPAPDDPAELVDGINAYRDGDFGRAKALLVPLANDGNPIAMNAMGLMHDFGLGFEKDPVAACDWYEKSASAGYVSGQYNLSVCFENGKGRLKNIDTMIALRKLSAEQGDKLAQLNMALTYRNRGGENDMDNYRYWALKASKNGSTLARVALWADGEERLVPDLSWTEIACVVVLMSGLGQSHLACD